MSEILAVTSGAEGRYAKALFSIALENKSLSVIENDLKNVKELIFSSSIFKDFIYSPLYNFEQQKNIILAISKKLNFSLEVSNLLLLMSKNRRLNLLSSLIKSFEILSRIDRGEIHAEVTSAVILSEDQEKEIKKVLKKNLGKEVILEVKIDNDIIGGLIFKIGSKMIDTSIKSKLFKLKTLMKEVGWWASKHQKFHLF